jgi:hypothetical protein
VSDHEWTWRHADGSVRTDHMDARPLDYYGPPPAPGADVEGPTEDGMEHCCMGGCVPKPCGCCVNEMFGHRSSCPESPAEQMRKFNEDYPIGSDGKRHPRTTAEEDCPTVAAGTLDAPAPQPCRHCGAPEGLPYHVYGERKCCPDCDHRPPPDVEGPTGDDLRRHMRDAHHFDPEYLRIVPDAALSVEHEAHHKDGLDMEQHTHA